MTKYIRGWRQLKAIPIFFKCLFTGNFPCAKREIEIMTGFAKPYKVLFHPMFWDSLREQGMDEEDITDLRRELEANKEE